MADQKKKMDNSARGINAMLGCGRISAEKISESLSDSDRGELEKRYAAGTGRAFLDECMAKSADAKRAAKAKPEPKAEPAETPTKKTPKAAE